LFSSANRSRSRLDELDVVDRACEHGRLARLRRAVQVAAFALRQRRDGAAETLELRVQALGYLRSTWLWGRRRVARDLVVAVESAELLVLLLLLLLLLLLVVGQSSVRSG